MPAETQAGKPRIDLSRYELTLDGQRVRLERQPMELLIFFSQRRGQLVNREEIVEKLWGRDVFVDVDSSINAAVRKIRTALKDDPAAPRYLETVVGKGYRFVGEVEVVAEALPVPNGAPTTEAHPALSRRRKTVLGFVLGVVFLVVLAVAAAIERWQNRNSTGSQIHSIAVLPLANLSGDPSQDYFADGMTEELTSDLSKISALRVISRTSAMQYKNAKKSLREIGRDLGADAVVEGSVERSGARVRINAQLIYAPTDSHLWAESYERDLGDVLGLQDEVANAIAHEIGVKLTPSERAHLTTSHSVSPEAHEAYLRGLYYMSKRDEEGVDKSIAYFQQATTLDPNYALAYAGLADAYALQGSLLYIVLPPKQVIPKSKAAAMKALQLDQDLAEAHVTLAYIETIYDWDWANSEEDFKRAIALNPNYSQAHLWYGMHLAALGRQNEAIAQVKRAHELDPLSLINNSAQGLMLYFGGEYDAAIDQLHATLELDSDFFVAHWLLGMAYEQKRQYEDARSEFQKARRLAPRNSAILESLGEIAALSGRKKESLEILRELNQLSKQEFVSPYNLALLNVALGDKDRALDSLQEAYAQRDSNIIYLKLDPALQSIRSDARFQELLRRIGLSKN